jgi:hypothetical protein
MKQIHVRPDTEQIHASLFNEIRGSILREVRESNEQEVSSHLTAALSKAKPSDGFLALVRVGQAALYRHVSDTHDNMLMVDIMLSAIEEVLE